VDRRVLRCLRAQPDLILALKIRNPVYLIFAVKEKRSPFLFNRKILLLYPNGRSKLRFSSLTQNRLLGGSKNSSLGVEKPHLNISGPIL
jgi:hypothetical protein